jgi:hypothetical protein
LRAFAFVLLFAALCAIRMTCLMADLLTSMWIFSLTNHTHYTNTQTTAPNAASLAVFAYLYNQQQSTAGASFPTSYLSGAFNRLRLTNGSSGVSISGSISSGSISGSGSSIGGSGGGGVSGEILLVLNASSNHAAPIALSLIGQVPSAALVNRSKTKHL